MKKLLAVAAFLLASTAAQAQYTFEYGGRTIRIDPDRGTVSIPGVYDNTGRRTKRSHGDQDSDRPRKQTPQQAKVDPQAPAAEPAVTEQAPAPANTQAPPSAATATVAPADTAASTQAPAAQPAAVAPAPQVQQDAAVPSAKPAAPEMVATTTPAPKPPAPAVQQANSPLGVWLTEEKEGKVRIEQCGANLCGYSVDSKSNQNGEQVLINMKPGKDSKWSGRILDPNSGSTYDFDDRAEGAGYAARSGLRLWRHVLRRPDLEPRELGCEFGKRVRSGAPEKPDQRRVLPASGQFRQRDEHRWRKRSRGVRSSMRSICRPHGDCRDVRSNASGFPSIILLKSSVAMCTQPDGLEKLSPPARRSGLIQDGNGCIGKRQNAKQVTTHG